MPAGRCLQPAEYAILAKRLKQFPFRILLQIRLRRRRVRGAKSEKRRAHLQFSLEREPKMGDEKKSYSSQAIDLDLKIQDAELIENYTDLRVYKLAFESAVHIFELSKKWPAEEKYSLTDQIRRCSRSVCANIAEAWRKRRYPAHFVSKLSDSDSEAAETEVWLDFSMRLGYLIKNDHTELRDDYDHICRMLTNMMTNPEPWCRRAKVEKRKA